jgi:hypothetical protein
MFQYPASRLHHKFEVPKWIIICDFRVPCIKGVLEKIYEAFTDSHLIHTKFHNGTVVLGPRIPHPTSCTITEIILET